MTVDGPSEAALKGKPELAFHPTEAGTIGLAPDENTDVAEETVIVR